MFGHLRCLAMSLAVSLAVMAGTLAPGGAATLPPVAELQARIGSQPVTVTVHEPHMPASGPGATIDYVGYPAATVLTLMLGPDWPNKGNMVSFQASDGYISRITVKQLGTGKAYLVFARHDGSPFVVDNAKQNETAVPLGPYYLVWTTSKESRQIAANASNWPYQVTDVEPFDETKRKAALNPPGLAPRYRQGANLIAGNCLNCHSVNGYGGNKVSTDLTNLAKEKSENDFITWVLNPTTVRPATTMPPLNTQWAENKRRHVAKAIYDYLKNVPGIE